MEAERVAILSDIHGNAAALEAVLDDVDADVFLLGGDYALLGPRPGEAVARLRGLGAAAVIGNTDRWLFDKPDDVLAQWTLGQLSAEDRAWLEGCAFDCRVVAPRGAELLFVHATPTDLEGLLITQPNRNTPWPVTSPEDAQAFLGDAVADVIVYGHIHYASAGEAAGRRVASVGSVGFPADGDPAAAYAIADCSSGQWKLEHRRVPYDHEDVAAEIRRQATPRAAIRARRLEEARFIPFA